MAIPRPTSGLTPEDLQPGQFVIGGGADGSENVHGNVDGFGIPRPVGGSNAPRPLGLSAFASRPTAVTPSDASKKLLGEQRDIQGKRTLDARATERARIAGAPAVQAQKLADEKKAQDALVAQNAQALAERGEGARVAGEQAQALERLRQEGETRELTSDELISKNELESAQRIAVLGDERAIKVEALKARTKIASDQLIQTGKVTPQETVLINKAEAIDERRSELEGDLASNAELRAKLAGTPAEAGLITRDESIAKKLESLDMREDTNTSEIEDASKARAVEQAKVATGAEGAIEGFEDGVEAVGDLNGDGTPNDPDDIQANGRIKFIRDYKQALKDRPNDKVIIDAGVRFNDAVREQAEWEKGRPNTKVQG